MSPSIGYIGSGNKTSVLTRRPKLPFKKIKEKEKLKTRERVKGQIKKQQQKERIIVIIVFLVAIGIFILARYMILGE